MEHAQDHYTIITADSHAGGSHAAYAEYLDPKYRDDFDAWRGRYRNPFKDLGDQRRFRNWDNEMRNSQQEADGVVGEVIFPNTVPPFFPSFVLFAAPPTPDEYEHRRAGIQAHNRWLVDFCNEYPERRAGIGQVFLNNVDDAIEDVRWIKEHGLRGGILFQPVPPDVHGWIQPLNHPDYDRLWAVCQDLEVPINTHGGVGSPAYPKLPSSTLLHIAELGFYSRRPLVWLLLGGVFERFPNLRLVMTEQGCDWVPALLEQLDQLVENVSRGNQGELRFDPALALPKAPSEYFRTNVWLGVSQPTPADVATRAVVDPTHFMWGSDYPHDEGTYPFTREHLRQVFPGFTPAEMRQILSENAAALYDFDLKALAPLAARFGPTVEEIGTPLDKLPDNPNEALLRGAAPPRAVLV